MSYFARSILLLFLTPVLGITSATAGTMSLDGDNVRFTFDDSTLFGAGTVSGDSISFTPSEFIAESQNTDGLVTESESLNIQIEILGSGMVMTDFVMLEKGDYRLDGANTTASATGTFTVDSNTSVFSDANALTAGPLLVTGALTEWEIFSLIELADTAGWGSDTDVDLTIFNELTAFSNLLGGSALVQKKLGAVGLNVMVTAIPAPAALWLLGSAIAAMGVFRRKV